MLYASLISPMHATCLAYTIPTMKDIVGIDLRVKFNVSELKTRPEVLTDETTLNSVDLCSLLASKR
jgi:hypothetical protein